MNKDNKVTNTAERAKADPSGYLLEAMVFGSSGFIERQEKQGQRELAESSVLPIEGVTDEQLAALGIQVLGPVEGDKLFRRVVLPNGWKIEPTSHSMWSSLLDDKGRERAGIFYKAAFYDRSAHMDLSRRYTCGSNYVYGNGEKQCPTEAIVVLKDGGSVIEEIGRHAYDDWGKDTELRKKAGAILDERWPDHNNPLAYWNE